MEIKRLRILLVILLLPLQLYSSPASQEAKPLSYSGNPALVKTARKYIGVREQGYNRGKEIGRWQIENGGKHGQSYCAYFVSSMLRESKSQYPTVRSGRAQAFRTDISIRPSHVAKGYCKVKEGWLLIWANFSNSGRNKGTGHIEINERQIGNMEFDAIGANTSSGRAGSQSDGDGVYPTRRRISEKGKFRLIAITPSW